MKKIYRIVCVLAAAVLLAGLNPITAAAEEITYENFDYIAYADRYPDLMQAFGYDRDSLYNHYVSMGCGEGRVARVIRILPDRLSVFGQKGKESYYFDASRYAADYPDLYAAFGDNKTALWNHYKTCGIAEGRTAYGITDAVNAKLRIFDVAASITDAEMTDREKVRAVHDWIVNNTVYDYQNYLDDTIPDISHEMEGVMLRGTAVCDGYAKTFDYFMYVLGIEDEYLVGMATNSSGESGLHAWNRVMIDGNWLYVDCTWDDPISNRGNILRHTYFLISYEEMSKSHTQTTAFKLTASLN